MAHSPEIKSNAVPITSSVELPTGFPPNKLKDPCDAKVDTETVQRDIALEREREAAAEKWEASHPEVIATLQSPLQNLSLEEQLALASARRKLSIENAKTSDSELIE